MKLGDEGNFSSESKNKGDIIRLVNKDTLIVDYNKKILLIDTKKRIIKKKIKFELIKKIDSLFILNEKKFLISGWFNSQNIIQLYVIDNFNLELKGSISGKNALFERYPEDRLITFYNNKITIIDTDKIYIHENIKCIGCNMNPIKGTRYKCNKCEGFNYCEKCYQEKKEKHGHDFIIVS